MIGLSKSTRCRPTCIGRKSGGRDLASCVLYLPTEVADTDMSVLDGLLASPGVTVDTPDEVILLPLVNNSV